MSDIPAVRTTDPKRTDKAEEPQQVRKRSSMHEGIAPWADCCSCEAEPYWAEQAEGLGIDIGSDYEDEEPSPPKP